MKYELLKRTAIALFVGGVISSYTLAAEQPATSPNNKLTDSFNNIEAAINKNDKNIKNITKLLVGDKNDEANPGLISTIDTINKQATDNANLLIKMAGKVDQNKKDTDAEIAKKADQSAVDDINTELDARAKALKTLQEEKASVKDLNAISENVKEGFDSIQDKVHNLQEALAGDGTDEKPGLIKSVSSAVEELNDNIAKKANQADVDAKIAKLEENQGEYNEGFRNELDAANETLDEHEAAIAKKANQADVDANKAEIEKIKNLEGYDSLSKVEALVSDKTKQVKSEIAKLEENQGEYNEGFRNELDAANETLDEHEAAIAKKANQADVDANKAEIAKKADKTEVDTLKNQAVGAAAAANLLAQNIGLNKTNIEKNASAIVNIRNKQVLQNARLDNHGERIEANEAAIGELAKATDKAVTNLGDTVRDLDADLAETQDAVAENRKDIDKNASRITDTRNKQVLQNARLDNHGERIEANEAAIDKLKETQTYKDLSKVETLVKDKADKTAVEKNVSRITDTRNKQVLQNARLDNHSERITAAEVALDTKADKTELAAKADKTELATKADKNNVYSKSDADQLFALKADNSVVNAHTKRLDHLDNRVNKLDKDLKRGLAAQAALTGLFQPYTVGKANFTAAVGGYKSQTAVAIGTGYRYNQNIATKAGVAFTQGGGVTYNAGVNFEW